MKYSEYRNENPEDMNFCENQMDGRQEANKPIEARKWLGDSNSTVKEGEVANGSQIRQ